MSFFPTEILRLIYDHADILTQRRMEKVLQWPCYGIKKIQKPAKDLLKIKKRFAFRLDTQDPPMYISLPFRHRYITYLRCEPFGWTPDPDHSGKWKVSNQSKPPHLWYETDNWDEEYDSLLSTVIFDPVSKYVEETYTATGQTYTATGILEVNDKVIAKYSGIFGEGMRRV